MPGSLLGTEVRRVEDPELLTGAGRYVDDLPLEGALHVAFVRSSMAHARVRSVDVDEAAAAPGVAAVYRASDLDLGPTPAFISLNPACVRPPLATDRVRFVGEPVAAVVAESRAGAIDAAELVVVDYDPLPVAADPEEALAPDATPQFDDLGTNLVAGFRDDPAADPLADADVVVRGRFVNQRVAVVPMEGDAIAVEPGEPGSPVAFTVHVSTQTAHIFQGIACHYFGLAPQQLHVIAPFVGGGFGAKSGLMAEHLVAMEAARRLGRRVKWVETRSENLVTMPHGRGQVHYVELGCRRDGTIVGLHTRVIGDAGAYAGFGGALALGPTRTMATGVYRVPALAYDVAAVVTNTTPMGAFRGAGRPEAAELLERIIDMAADELGIDPVELRQRNLLRPDEFPFTTLTDASYDCGAYGAALEEACRIAGYEKLRSEQAERRARGDRVQLGIGVSTYVEITSGGATTEFGAVEVHGDGSATIRAGTSSHGQGHATSFAMLVADRLGIPLGNIHFVQADTAEVPRGIGTFGSRSLQIGGNAVLHAADEVLEQARQLAADELEAAPGDIVVTDDGRVGVAGVPARAIAWGDLAQRAEARGEPLAFAGDFSQSDATFPFGAHVSVVEVDLDTGMVRPLRHVAVDDCGRIVNPLIVRGQQHGGVAQGMAQALWEQVVYDAEGNPLTSNLAEYAMPSAAELVSIEASNIETPTPRNPLGAKGIGESGTIGAMPAVHNAVIDAVSHLGVRHIDMPCTPERVWQAVRDADAGTVNDPWSEPPVVFASLPVRGDGPQGPSIDP